MTITAARVGLLAVATLALAAALPARAEADTKATCDVLEINASSAKEASMPKELKPLEKKLKKAPFSSWNVFKLLSQGSKAVVQQKAEAIKLTMGQATVLLGGTSQHGKKTRFAVTVTMDDENGKRVADTKVSVDEGDYIVLGRTLANNEGYLFAMTCKP